MLRCCDETVHSRLTALQVQKAQHEISCSKDTYIAVNPSQYRNKSQKKFSSRGIIQEKYDSITIRSFLLQQFVEIVLIILNKRFVNFSTKTGAHFRRYLFPAGC